MGDTITISQSPNAETLILYPTSDDATGWTSTTGSANFVDVADNKDSPNDDANYCYMASNSTLTDRYGFQNHTTEAGTINFLQLRSRARANTVAQHSTGVFREVVYSASPGYDEGTNHGPLPLGYNNYKSKWLENPFTSAAWTWTNIDGLLAGIRATSPTVTTGVQTTVFRPNAAGDKTELNASAGNNYACVDETPANEDTDYVYYSQGPTQVTKTDLYNIPNHTTETGTINFIEIFTRTRWAPHSSNTYMWHRQALKIGGTEYQAALKSATSYYYNRSAQWATNPFTSAAWTWTDIDNLQIGLDIQVEYGSVRCTQVYVVVNYTEAIIPQIRCTQLYAEVNYTPSARNLTLSKPHDLERGHAHDVRRTQLRSVSKVGDFGDGDNYLTMGGFESTSAQSRMATLELMFQNGAPVTIAGLDDTALNTEYQIADRSYTEHAGAGTIYYEWTLKLRKT